MRDANEQDWVSLVAKFRARVAESAKRIKMAKAKVGKTASFVGRREPETASAELVREDKRLTQ